MQTLTLNIGLKQGAHYPAHSASKTIDSLKTIAGDTCKITKLALANSDSERTLIATVETMYPHTFALWACWDNRQEDVAYTIDGVGYMVHDSWGPFDPNYFLINGKDITQCF